MKVPLPFPRYFLQGEAVPQSRSANCNKLGAQSGKREVSTFQAGALEQRKNYKLGGWVTCMQSCRHALKINYTKNILKLGAKGI